MFKRLKDRFVLITIATTTVVMVIAFSAIYFVAADHVNHRPRVVTDQYSELFDGDLSNFIEDRLSMERKDSLSTLLTILLTTGLFVELTVLLFSLYFAERAIKPVRDAYNAQKTFIANASHEIKTPLAAIQANLEAADIQGNHWIDNVATEVEDLAALNAQLLTLARVEGEAPVKKELTSVKYQDYVQQLVEPLTPRLEQKKIKLTIKTDKLAKPTISLPKADFKQIFCILFDNAIKYCDHQITITLADNALTITNDGTTVSAEKLQHIFERFYQADKTKNGVGLGLAIAQQVAKSNGWKLTATSDEHTTSFRLAL